MSNLACIAPRCALPRRHAEGCTNDTCRGCLPALAQDGLRLCPLHTTRISTDALRIAELDHEIEEVLARSGRVGERTSGTADHGTVLNDRAVEVRTEIRHTLVAWCRLVAEERGIHLPPNHLDAMAAYLATHHVWLAAHKTANDSSDELSSLARRAYSAAHSRTPCSRPASPAHGGTNSKTRPTRNHTSGQPTSGMRWDGRWRGGPHEGHWVLRVPHRWPRT